MAALRVVLIGARAGSEAPLALLAIVVVALLLDVRRLVKVA